MAGVSGAGAEVTALAESLQAYACAARQFKKKDLVSMADLNDRTTKDADCDRKLKDCIEKLDAAWHYSVIETANQMFKDLKLTSHKFYRGGEVPKIVYDEFRQFKKESPFSGEDKWNPADIWAIKKSYKPKTGFKNLVTYNKYILDAFKKKDLIGISLKKIGPKQKAHSKVFNAGKPVEATFQGIKIGSDVTASKDAYIIFMSEGGPGLIQLRNFSSRPEPSSWQGEIKGKFAAAGKVGGGLLMAAAVSSGVPSTKLMIPQQFKQYIDKPTPQIIKDFCMMFKDISKVTTPVDKLVPTVTAQIKKDKTWWMSKFLSVHYCYTITKLKKANDVTAWLYGYGSSATNLSSAFIKYS